MDFIFGIFKEWAWSVVDASAEAVIVDAAAYLGANPRFVKLVTHKLRRNWSARFSISTK